MVRWARQVNQNQRLGSGAITTCISNFVMRSEEDLRSRGSGGWCDRAIGRREAIGSIGGSEQSKDQSDWGIGGRTCDDWSLVR